MAQLDRNVPRRIRVCIVIDDLKTGGTEYQVLALLSQLPAQAIDPVLVLLRSADTESLSRKHIPCPILELTVRSLVSWHGLTSLLRLARFLRNNRVEVVQLYFRDSTIAATLAARLAGLNCIVRMRTNLGHDFTATDRLVNSVLAPLQSATLSNCRAGQESLLYQEPRLCGKLAQVIPNGVDQINDYPRRLTSTSNPIVGCVANFRPVKGLACMLRAAVRVRHHFPTVRFHFAGTGPQQKDLAELRDQLGLQQCCDFVGSVNAWDFARTIDVAVNASRSEGLSNAILEYMANGLPIVATDVGGTRELIEDQITGLLVPTNQPESIAQAIILLLQRPFLAKKLGRAARDKVRGCFNREQMVTGYANFYRRLVAT